MSARWQLRFPEPDIAQIGELADALGLHPMIARLLVARGLSTASAAGDFLNPRLADLPDPFLLKGMGAAVKRIAQAIAQAEEIVVHGDYDVDGITGTALLVEFLRQLGAKVRYHIPLRLQDGYGLSTRAIEEAVAAGAGLMLSVDCGVSALAEAALARSLGLDLIITDHHQPLAQLPDVPALLNPHQADCRFPFKELAGVGVAFFLAAGLRKELRRQGHFQHRPEPDLRQQLDLVALGTIADMVPLQGVNRILAKAGLEILQRGDRPGIQALRRVAGVKEITCGAVGFQLAPRLNAAGRLEDAARGVELLLGSDSRSCRQTADFLDACNRERQALEHETFLQAVAKVEAEGGLGARHVLVLSDPDWHSGVIGIVASRLVERYHRPTVLISWDGEFGKGSARSIGGFHLFHGLQRCGEWLEGFGGHAFAAGLTIRKEHLAGFSAALETIAREVLTQEMLAPTIRFDGEIGLPELNRDLLNLLARLAPFGIGNPEPVWLAPKLRIDYLQEVGNGHLRFQARQGGYSCPCIAFGMAERRHDFHQEVDLLFVPGINTWNDRESLQLRVRDVRPA